MKKKYIILTFVICMILSLIGCDSQEEDAIVLRISNWEEYIDEGDWDEEEIIDIDDETNIFGERSLVEEFEDYFYETYGKKVVVEYSTFGTNEELYNQLTIGDVYDLVCPSEYMIMKMMREDMLLPFSPDFYNNEIETNYYSNCVSPYIKDIYDNLSIGNEPLSKYAAGYMWGTLGLVYNPEEVTEEEASHWDMMLDKKFDKKVTVKDSVRDAFFAAVTYVVKDEITTDEFINSPDYKDRLSEVLNRTDVNTVDRAEEVLTAIKNNVYSFETDSGKADMVTGKVVANEQWSGDAVYTMDQADEDDVELCYSVPLEGSNLWFDGWVMLKEGIGNDPDKQLAAQEFINFVSMPENAIRNMYYIGYTSVIGGGDSELIYDYMDWNYGVDPEEEEEYLEYDVSYFYDGEDSGEYTIYTSPDQVKRQLYAQYPPKEVVDRCVVMACFDEESNSRINRMWTNVRCFDLKSLFE